jgi:tRNA pseudouridine38-40 synthase
VHSGTLVSALWHPGTLLSALWHPGLWHSWHSWHLGTLRTLKLTVQYDGTDYVGWQRQPNGVSIQALIEDALAPIEGRSVTVQGAGRTDAGVHAMGQVASVSLASAHDAATLARALNAVLPPDVRILSIEDAAPEFHARFSAVAKTYEYRLVNAPLVSPFVHRYVWHVVQPLALDAMREAAAALTGLHDFAAFQAAGSKVDSTERLIERIDWEDGGGYDLPLVMRITGEGFLRHMVRNIVGTLVEVGTGRWPAPCVAEILASRDRTLAGPTAPARGLFLMRVDY